MGDLANMNRLAVQPLDVNALRQFGEMRVPSMREHKPGLRELLGNYVYDAANSLGMRNAAQGMRENAQTAADFVPGVGDAIGAQEAGAQFGMGNYGAGAAGLGLAAIGAVPGVGDLAAGGIKKGIRAYHGSPHSFDKFDLSKIGTGEGAQAYGHGLYFAENEGVARDYRDKLSDDYFETASGGIWSPDSLEHINVRALLRRTGDLDEALNKAKQMLPDAPDATREMLQGDISALERLKAGGGIRKKPSGSMYEVNINANPDDFLDWDKPLSEQPKKVQEWFDGRGVTPGFAGQQSGNELFQMERGALGDEALAQSMREGGVPGVKYLDHGSRFNAVDGMGAKTNTRNYVVFDDKLIDIVKKYGIAGALGAGLITQEMAEQMQAQGLGEQGS